MENNFLFAYLNLNRIIQKKKRQRIVHFMDDALETRGIIYLNIETWLLFASPIKISGYAPVWVTANTWGVVDFLKQK